MKPQLTKHELQEMKALVPDEGINIIEWLTKSAMQNGETEEHAKSISHHVCKSLGFEDSDIVFPGSAILPNAQAKGRGDER